MRILSVNVLFLLLFTLVLFLPLCPPAFAASIPHGSVVLVAENQWIAPGYQTYFGLKFDLEKGWHIYWVNPGDSGEPPRIEWHLPAGISAGEIEWPAPRRLGTPTIVDFGYVDAVMLVVPVRASSTVAANQPAQVGVDLRVLVCREICVPGKTQILLTLPIKSMPPKVDSRTSDLFTAARKSMPRQAPGSWEFSASEQKDSFVLSAKLGREITRATFLPLVESQIDNSAPQKFVATPNGFRLTLRKSDQLLNEIKRLKGVLELSANQTYMIEVAVGNTQLSK